MRSIHLLSALLVLAATSASATAQTRDVAPFATRDILLARAAHYDTAARTTTDRRVWKDNAADITSIRERLRDGDFNVGDRVVLRVANVPALTDTFVVRGGRTLELPNIGTIPLTGVLWSELTPYLTTQIGKYVVNPTVEAHPLVRVAVSGDVEKPGFYVVRPDMLVSDAIMSAGGVSKEGDVTKTTIRRDGKDIWKPKQLQTQIASGATVDQLDLRAGDEIYVGDRTKHDWGDIFRTSAYVGAVIASLYAGGHFF